MGLFDGLVTQVASRFNLGDRAGPLLTALLGLVTDSGGGGLTGFLERLRRGGLGEQVNSWVGTGPNAPVSTELMHLALGNDSLDRVSASAGVAPGPGRAAMAYLIPKVIDLLTPGGTVPAGLPAGVGDYLSGASAAGGAAMAGARDAMRSAGSGIGSVAAGGSSGLRKLVPVLLVLLLVFLGYRMLGRRAPATVPLGTDTTAMARMEPATGAGADSAAEPTTTGMSPSAEPAAAVEGAMKKASAALAALPAGYSASQLVEALNLNIINFAPGKAEIPPQSSDILDQSGKAIAGAPAGTVLEIGGHTDNTGRPEANDALSARRAAAVREYLVRQGVKPATLVAKGYGASKPVSDNSTADGWFQNRRFEFTVVKLPQPRVATGCRLRTRRRHRASRAATGSARWRFHDPSPAGMVPSGACAGDTVRHAEETGTGAADGMDRPSPATRSLGRTGRDGVPGELRMGHRGAPLPPRAPRGGHRRPKGRRRGGSRGEDPRLRCLRPSRRERGLAQAPYDRAGRRGLAGTSRAPG
jgi:outer membrane protein OmpA-like peptidoglycan-associated protein/uncharacterized protein YidB (DUF937 family)